MTHEEWDKIMQNPPECPTHEGCLEKVRTCKMDDAFSWGRSIFMNNCCRLYDVYEKRPQTFSTNHFLNPEKIPDTVARIVNPGEINGRDEEHCFDRIRRTLLDIPEGAVEWTYEANEFRDAVLMEIDLLTKHNPCGELIDYTHAFKELISVVFKVEYACHKPEVYQALINTYCDNLVKARYQLYKYYEMLEQKITTDCHENLDAKLDKAVKTLSDKVDTATETVTTQINVGEKSIIEKVGHKIVKSRKIIIQHLPKADDSKEIKNAMIERVKYLIKKVPTVSIRNHCQNVYNEFKGIPGAYANSEVLRKSLLR